MHTPVYDILNCGPRHRFMANGKLVHNSEKLNLQNLNRGSDLRKALIAPPNHLVYVADSSNIEARMLAWEAGQDDLLTIFREGGDVYSHTATAIYNREIDKKRDPHERFVGKVTCLAADTKIITDKGIKPIVDVQFTDRLWDGEQWVQHSGLIHQGQKATIPVCGARMTPDHLILSGNEWLQARYQEHDESILCRMLATGSEALQSLVTSLDNEVDSKHWLLDVIAEQMSTQSMPTTYNSSRQPGATPAPKKHLPLNGIGNTRPHWGMTTTAHACSTACQQPSGAVTTQTTRCIPTMGRGGSQSILSGGPIAQAFLSMCSNSLGGVTPNSKWTGPMLTMGTSRETSGLSPDLKTRLINAVFRLCKRVSQSSNRKSSSCEPVYDLVDAGPNNRFTILTDAGPMVVHNCLGLGYGMGWRKAKDTFAAGALGGPPVFFEDHEIQHIVNVYRNSNFHIVNLWREADQAIVDMYLGNERTWRMLEVRKNMLVMPNGMTLRYEGLRTDSEYGGNFEYWNGKFFTKIYGGKLVENLTQALARIVLFTQMLAIDKYARQYGGRVVLNVHDEVIAVAPDFGAKLIGYDEGGNELWENNAEADKFFEGMRQIMLQPPDWATDLPLDAEGGYAIEYSK